MIVLTTLLIIRSLKARKNKTYAGAMSGTNNIRGKPVEDVQKIRKEYFR